MLKQTIAFLASALTIASWPALAVDLPDYGSKNFSPSGDTPAYFANESVPVSARTADTTERDWSAVDAIAPSRPVGSHGRSAHSRTGRHGRYAFPHGSGAHNAAGSGGNVHATRAGSGHSGWAARRPSVHVSYSNRSAPAGAARTTSAKHGKPGARHAAGGNYDQHWAGGDAKALG
jgi:hypothetical protein